MQDPLAALRPLHTPEPIAWWPPAPGWWLLLLLVLCLALVLAWRWRRDAPQRAALRELMALEALDPPRRAAALNRLLKRYALVCWPRSETAGLTGEAWLAFLDRHGGKGRFQQAPGRRLMQRTYAPPVHDHGTRNDQDADFLRLARCWIKANKPRAKKNDER